MALMGVVVAGVVITVMLLKTMAGLVMTGTCD